MLVVAYEASHLLFEFSLEYTADITSFCLYLEEDVPEPLFAGIQKCAEDGGTAAIACLRICQNLRSGVQGSIYLDRRTLHLASKAKFSE